MATFTKTSRSCICAGWLISLWLGDVPALLAQNRFATSDNLSGYVHWIELYDAENNRIDPRAEFPEPYSPERTCGRCHEFDTISHGWHFDAVDPKSSSGRPGQPWIWSDPRSGTHLPLSYRGWEGTYDPDVLGLSRWEVAAKLGGFLPGGGPGSSDAMSGDVTAQADPTTAAEAADRNRSHITGPLPVDCLMCHRNRGSGYSPFVWTEQVQEQNFSYAPTVALGLATISGNMARLRELDPQTEDDASKLPKLTYDAQRFRADGKVFIDLVRKPANDACYYCHTNTTADALTGLRWLHDEDVHVRAGLACSDCHRNGLDHRTVRGYEQEEHPAGASVAALSCQGCHMGSDAAGVDVWSQPGRLGAPRPAHKGLPPLHFEKLSCTACHSGPLPEQSVPRQINSMAHHLGEHVKRTGEEFPAIFGPVQLPQAHAKYTPQRLLWPAYWGTLEKQQVTPLNPETAYQLVRRALKVRRDFTEELADVSLSLTERKKILGDERARVKEEERTPEEQRKIAEAQQLARTAQINERMLGALAAIEEAYPGKQAVYVTAGTGWIRYGEDKLKQLTAKELGTAGQPYAWPQAHNVRPARQSLGVHGCTECHSDQAKFFFADVHPVSLMPGQEVPAIKVHQLQQADLPRLQLWNQLFAGRSNFKVASLIALSLTGLITLSALAWNIGSWLQRRSN